MRIVVAVLLLQRFCDSSITIVIVARVADLMIIGCCHWRQLIKNG